MVPYLFCISKHAQHDPLRMEVFKRKENPRRFMRISYQRKCYHVRAEFISASGVSQSCAIALTEEWEANTLSQLCLVRGLENNHTQICCVRSQWWSCCAFLASILSSLHFSPAESTQPETGPSSMAAVLTRKVIIYKMREKSVMMDWLEKNVPWLDIRMSEYLLQCDCHLSIRKLPELSLKKDMFLSSALFLCLPRVSGITAAT